MSEYLNDPLNVAAKLETHESSPKKAISLAAEVVRNSLVRGRPGLGVCMDLAHSVIAPESSVILSEMFARGHPVLPVRWRQNPEIIRTILSIAVSLDIGLLQAMLFDQSHSGGNAELDKTLSERKEFLVRLQQKA